jgi:hypothetical protein
MVDTQPQRLAEFEKEIHVGAATLSHCAAPIITFKSTRHDGSIWYDVYSLEGCGHKTDYVVAVTKNETGGTWAVSYRVSIAAPDDTFRAEAKAQLVKSAQFDLDCKSDLQFEILNETLDPLQTTYLASVGVRGCDKKSTYRTTCLEKSYDSGKYDIDCKSVVTTTTDTK